MIIDSSAWIEVFIGNDKGRDTMSFMEREEAFTSIVSLAEIAAWCVRNNIRDKIRGYIELVKKNSKIIQLDEAIATFAGIVNHERKKIVKNWGMMDSFILATALAYSLKVLTKDSHFKDLNNAEIL